ncbi:MAG: tryptophan synthase subunit alpha [Candidatus Moranbacteria bacterium]|nr:tryptophan synthase subunit alpha [Candidatus Moranbacteria bacterium]
MKKIKDQLNKIKKENRLGVMTHIVVGYPSLEENKKMIQLMAETGVDFIELQIPFSDPMADGPMIMKANKESLDQGTKVRDAFMLMREMSQKIEIPLLFMGYFNTVLNYGTEKFCHDASQAGCSGLIFPDIPLEEEKEENFIKHTNEFGMNSIRVLSPASTTERIKKNSEVASGFVYFVGRKGTTGAKKSLDSLLEKNIERLKKHIKIPVAVGFGISNATHVRSLVGKADVVVVGSALLEAYELGGMKKVGNILESIVDATR